MYNDESQNDFEFIVKYSGDIKKIADELDIPIEILNDNYAIILAEPQKINLLASYSEIEYMERAKLLGIINNLLSSCISSVQNNLGLTGKAH